MALDPQIALGVRPPVIQPLQIPNPLEQFAKVQSLRNLMTQGQLGQMNLEQTQLENEAKQRQAQEEQSLGSWMKQNQGRPDLTPQEIVAAHPNPTGIKVATAWSAQQTAALTQRKTVLDVAHEEAKTDDRIYNSVIDDQTKAAAITDLVKLRRIDGNQASHLLSIPFDSPEFKGIQQRAAAASLDRLQRIEAEKNGIALRIAQNTEGAVTQGAIADSSKKRTDAEQARVAFDAAKLAAAYDQSPEAGAAALAALDPERAKPFLNASTAAQVRNIGLTPHEQATAQQAADTAAATEKQRGVQNKIDQARLGIAQQELGLKLRGDTNDDELATTVIANPSLYDNLTPSAKTRIAPLLSKQGFTEFGKPMGEAAMTKISESRSAIESLKDLRQTLKDNEQYIGPLSGFQALNPYSEARLAQAKIDLVKQRVGKALEGGVLRKEDEEKYKKILATLHDTPATALAKVDNLLTTVDRDIKVFENEQRRGGRNVPADTSAAPTAAAPKAAPDPVKSLLGSSKPGTYTLSDGTKWTKKADGTVTAAGQ